MAKIWDAIFMTLVWLLFIAIFAVGVVPTLLVMLLERITGHRYFNYPHQGLL